jgi:hypothetical protein
MKLIQANEKILVRASEKAFEERTQEKNREHTQSCSVFLYTPAVHKCGIKIL